jgi:multidrug efflux pump subunit AcrA (membrane-fusion protein)
MRCINNNSCAAGVSRAGNSERTMRGRLAIPIASRHLALRFVSFVCCALMAACSSTKNETTASHLIVVKATATGMVERVLVNEGTEVNAGAAILEIAVPAGASITNQNQARESAQSAVSRAERDARDAEAEVNRAAVEVQRVEPLVATGAAPQAQLDAARAQYQHAQERVERLRDSARQAISRAVTQEGSQSASAIAPAPTIVAVSAPAAGNLRVVSVHAGQSVTAGQPIATISTREP